MSEFETQVLAMFKKLDDRMGRMESRMDRMETRMDRMESDIASIKEDATITRAAVNYNGERLDNLIRELRANQVIA